MINADVQNASSDAFAVPIAYQSAAEQLELAGISGLFGTSLGQKTLRTSPSRILICRPNGRLGNTLLLTPLMQELECVFPGAEIDVVSACPAAPEIFREFSTVRTIHQVPRLGARHPVRTLAKFVTAKQTRYDLVIDPCPQSWTSRFWTRSMHSHAVGLGFRSPFKPQGIDYGVPFDAAPRHMGQYPVYLLRRFTDAQIEDHEQRSIPPLSIKLTRTEADVGSHTLHKIFGGRERNEPVVCLFLNATGEKREPVAFWRRLVECLRDALPRVKVLEIIPVTGERLLPEVPGYFSSSIRRIAGVINATDWFVSADSGVMHLGAATGTPTFGLFNVSDPAKYGPYGGKNAAIEVDKIQPQHTIDRIAGKIGLELRRRHPADTYPLPDVYAINRGAGAQG